MALPSRPLAILDAQGASRSIAREVDGNATAPKSLDTLGDTAFGGGSAPHAMSEFEGYSAAKDVCMCTFFFGGSCGSPFAANCSCLVVDPLMVSGDRFDANINWLLKNDSVSVGYSCIIIRCNGSIIMNCSNTAVGCCNGTYVAQDIDFNDTLTSTVCAGASSSPTITCSCSALTALTDQQQSSFTVGTSDSNFVIASNLP
jgi:hypothetical protein